MAVTSQKSGSWIRRFHPSDEAAARVVCLPHAGGSATYFFPMSRSLMPEIEVLSVQYPGRQDRRDEQSIDDIATLADILVEELRPWQDKPMAVFGHSLGAIVGYELVRRMQRNGATPLGMLASGRRAPAQYRDERIHLRDDDGLVDALQELSGTDPSVLGDEELLRLILPAVRSDYKAVETYRHEVGAELACPIQVLVGDNDPVTSVQEAEAWNRHTTSTCEVEVFPGGHFYLNDQVDDVLKTVVRCIDDWSATTAL